MCCYKTTAISHTNMLLMKHMIVNLKNNDTFSDVLAVILFFSSSPTKVTCLFNMLAKSLALTVTILYWEKQKTKQNKTAAHKG